MCSIINFILPNQVYTSFIVRLAYLEEAEKKNMSFERIVFLLDFVIIYAHLEFQFRYSLISSFKPSFN